MRKNRNKKKAKQNADPAPVVPVNISLPSNISKEEIQHIIACAIVEAEEIKAKCKADKKAEEKKEWHKAIGYDESRKGIAKCWNIFISTLRTLFIPKKYIKGDRISTALIQILLCYCFYVLYLVCTFLALVLVIAIPDLFAQPGVERFNWLRILICAITAIFIFIISRLFRIASIEAEKMEDRNNLYGLFASIASIISIVIAIIAIVRGG